MNDKLKCVIEAMENTKAEDILAYDFSSLNPFIDVALICSADNIRQTYAVASNIKDTVKKAGYEVTHIEGSKNSKWILIDLDTIIVHVFLDEERKNYNLEELYSELNQIDVTNL